MRDTKSRVNLSYLKGSSSTTVLHVRLFVSLPSHRVAFGMLFVPILFGGVGGILGFRMIPRIALLASVSLDRRPVAGPTLKEVRTAFKDDDSLALRCKVLHPHNLANRGFARSHHVLLVVTTPRVSVVLILVVTVATS